MNTSTYRPGGRIAVIHLGPDTAAAGTDVAPGCGLDGAGAGARGSAQPDRSELIADVARFLQRRPRRPDSLRHALAVDPTADRKMWPINGESSVAARLRPVAGGGRPVAW